MSLYRYVGSKDELLVLMSDMAFHPGPELAAITGGKLPGGLQQWADALWAAYQRHPWLAEMPVSGPPRGPNSVVWMDAGLRAMRDTGLDWMTKVRVLTVVSGYVQFAARMAQQLEQGMRQSELDPAEAAQKYGREMAKLIDPELFPDAAEFFAAAIFETPPAPPGPPAEQQPSETDFAFGLRLILKGLAAAANQLSQR
jgi:AcrR family transcriptional regulator